MFEHMRQIVCVRGTAVFMLPYLLSLLDVYAFMTLCTGLSLSSHVIMFRLERSRFGFVVWILR